MFGSGINSPASSTPGDKSVNGFAGDTAGAFFNNTAGGDNGEEVRPIFASADATDAADWPDDARVPCAAGTDGGALRRPGAGHDPQGDLFDPPLQGGIAASQGDVWFVSWEGNPARLESRAHPLGIVVETRALGWNFPSGNEDIIYFIYTFYNVTSTNPADYAAIRPAMRDDRCCRRPRTSRRSTPPSTASTCRPAATPSTTCSPRSWRTWTWPRPTRTTPASTCRSRWATPTSTTSARRRPEHRLDLRPGHLRLGAVLPRRRASSASSTSGARSTQSPGNEVGLTCSAPFSRSSGSLQDPNDDKQLYRYISGGLSCRPTAPARCPTRSRAKICFVNIGSPADMRFFQSSGPLNLAPGRRGHDRRGVHLRRAGLGGRLPRRRAAT